MTKTWTATFRTLDDKEEQLKVEAPDYEAAQLLVMGIVPWILVLKLEAD